MKKIGVKSDPAPFNSSKDVWWSDSVLSQEKECDYNHNISAEDPLFILYTSGRFSPMIN